MLALSHVKTVAGRGDGRQNSRRPGLSRYIRSIPIVDPVVDYSVGLVIPQRDPMTPLIAALVQVARGSGAELE